jgi:nucleotide-binding universal stress UspA family protein
MIALRNILVATDFSEASDAALRYGRDFARQFGATLHVLHVVENVMARFAADAAPVTLPSLQQEIEQEAQQRLDATLTEEDRRDLHAKGVLRTAASPAAAVVEYAAEARADLIIMGTHGRGAVAHFLMGSVAERVVRTASCPVLTVRHPERDFVVPDALVAMARTAESTVAKSASTAARIAFLLLLAVGVASAQTQPASPPASAAAVTQEQPAPEHQHGTPATEAASHAAPDDLVQLAARMNAATGTEKIALMADLLTRLVTAHAAGAAHQGHDASTCPMCQAGAPMTMKPMGTGGRTP